MSFVEIVSYAMGEGSGYEEGYRAGEASSTAYQDGYTAGETAGYASGYSTGYDEGVASVTSIKDLIEARGNVISLFSGITADSSGTVYQKVSQLLNYSDTENISIFNNMFATLPIEELPDFDKHNATSFASFLNGSKVIQNVNLKTYNATNFNSSFNACDAIRNITIDNNDNILFTSMYSMFKGCKNLKSVTFTHTPTVSNNALSFEGIFYNAMLNTADGETFPYIDTSNVESFYDSFAVDAATAQHRLLNIPLYNLSSASYNSLGKMLTNRLIYEIPNLVLPNMNEWQWNDLFSNKSNFNYFFKGNTVLGKLGFTNIMYKLDISVSNAFTRDTLNEVIGNLADLTGRTAKTLVIGATNLAKLTEDDIAVATDKNWTVA